MCVNKKRHPYEPQVRIRSALCGYTSPKFLPAELVSCSGEDMRRVALGLTMSLSMCVMGSAQAADPAVVANLTAARVVVQADGKEALASADRARPGDLLEYRVDYHNTTRASINDVVATLPVPQNGVEYIPGSESPANALASIDGKTFAALPLKRAVKMPNGRTEMQR